MSWDTRRLASAIESAAMILAFAALLIMGHPKTGWALFILTCINDVYFAKDWFDNGAPRK